MSRSGTRYVLLASRIGLAACAVLAAGALAWPTGSGTAAAAGAAGAKLLGPGPATVRLDIEHSRFSKSRVWVRPHTEVRFVIVNHDPIGHELIVGGPEIQALHESGTHAQHGTVDGEVSVNPGQRAETTYFFHEPGPVVYACHLPGHFQFGMKGKVIVKYSDDPSA